MGLFTVLANESIAHTVLGNDNPGCVYTVAQLLSQVLDVHPEQVAGILVSFAPDLTQQIFVCHQASFIPHQVMEQLHLGGSELYRFVFHLDLIGNEIDRQVTANIGSLLAAGWNST